MQFPTGGLPPFLFRVGYALKKQPTWMHLVILSIKKVTGRPGFNAFVIKEVVSVSTSGKHISSLPVATPTWTIIVVFNIVNVDIITKERSHTTDWRVFSLQSKAQPLTGYFS